VQGLSSRAHNTRYRLERGQTLAGETLLGELSEGSTLVQSYKAIFSISIIRPLLPALSC
jgi:hypothetical protein